MNTLSVPNLRLASWLMIAAPVVLIVSLIAFGSVALRTSAFNQLETVAEVSKYVFENRVAWISLSLGLLAGITLTYAGLILIARFLMNTPARIWSILSLVSLAGSIAFLLFSTYFLIGLAAGPDHLPPLLAEQVVSKERAVIGTIYEHIAGLLATLGMTFLGIGLFSSRLLRRIGLIIAVLASLLTIAGLLAGAVPGPIAFLSLPIGIGLLRQKRVLAGADQESIPVLNMS
jgi:hypothetical protein